MASHKVTAAFQSEIDQTDSIVYLPEGKHTISAVKGGKPKTLEVTVDKRVLASFSEDLKQRHAANVRPFAGFDHTGGKASFLPKEFRYESGVGLILDVEWTKAGRESVEGKEYSYFSPTFRISDDGIPEGLTQRGEIGSLVNDPAFEEIPRIAASHQETETDKNMIQHLVELGLVEAGHDEATALDVAKAKLAEIRTAASTVKASSDETAATIAALEADKAALASEVATLKAANESAAEATAEAAITEAVTAGRIAPQDDKTKAFWKSCIKADPSAITVLQAIPGKDVTKTVFAGRVEANPNDGDEKPTGLDRAIKAHKASKNK
jgi:phage I-like protein